MDLLVTHYNAPTSSNKDHWRHLRLESHLHFQCACHIRKACFGKPNSFKYHPQIIVVTIQLYYCIIIVLSMLYSQE